MNQSIASPAVRQSTWTAILLCALATAAGAQLAMPLPYTPVPVTWQVAGVLFAGLVLAPRAAFASQALYVCVGAAGAPVFAQLAGGLHVLFGPTGGYLLSYPFAALAVSILCQGVDGAAARRIGACLAGIVIIYALGCLQLALVLRLSVYRAIVAGAVPFVFWDLAKALVVVAAVGRFGGGDLARLRRSVWPHWRLRP